jgi:hypothetical protein
MTALRRRIATAIEADPKPMGPPWRWYNQIAAEVGCSSQSVYNLHRARQFRPAIAEPTICRECGRAMEGGANGFCRRCCVAFGRSWVTR